MNCAGDHLLARAGFPRDEHGALRLRDHFRRLDHLLHAPASPDDAVVIELGVALADQVSVLELQALVFDRAIRDDEQFVDLERLLQIVEGPELHRLDRALDRRVRGHHDDLRPLRRRLRRQLANEVEPGQLRHQVVDHEQVEHALRQEPLRLARAGGRHHFVAFAAQRLREGGQDLRLVIDEQDGCVWLHV
jgi:hypothetical protein